MPRREYCFGIYTFTDNETGNIIYIGKDSHIDVNERLNAHYRPSAYNQQQINRVLQNNPDRYSYKVYCHASSVEELNQIEFDLINLYRPKFNYKHGGQGKYINRDFIYTVVKSGKSPEGIQKYAIRSMHRTNLISSVDYDYLEDIALELNNGDLSPVEVRQMKRRIIPSLETKMKTSKATNSTGFYRVQKRTDNTCKNGYIWVYEYYDENSKHKRFSRTDLFNLKAEVERRKMPWQIIDMDKAIKTVQSIHTGF